MASGGDDNKLVISLVDSSDGKIVVSNCGEEGIHSSQITGIRILSGSLIVSAAVDQRVILWNYSVNQRTLDLKLKPIGSYITSVADISSIGVIPMST